MKNISELIDRCLIHAIAWIGSPTHGLPEDLEIRLAAESEREHPAPRRMRLARA